jgi:hypothetical protein
LIPELSKFQVSKIFKIPQFRGFQNFQDFNVFKFSKFIISKLADRKWAWLSIEWCGYFLNWPLSVRAMCGFDDVLAWPWSGLAWYELDTFWLGQVKVLAGLDIVWAG